MYRGLTTNQNKTARALTYTPRVAPVTSPGYSHKFQAIRWLVIPSSLHFAGAKEVETLLQALVRPPTHYSSYRACLHPTHTCTAGHTCTAQQLAHGCASETPRPTIGRSPISQPHQPIPASSDLSDTGANRLCTAACLDPKTLANGRCAAACADSTAVLKQQGVDGLQHQQVSALRSNNNTCEHQPRKTHQATNSTTAVCATTAPSTDACDHMQLQAVALQAPAAAATQDVAEPCGNNTAVAAAAEALLVHCPTDNLLAFNLWAADMDEFEASHVPWPAPKTAVDCGPYSEPAFLADVLHLQPLLTTL